MNHTLTTTGSPESPNSHVVLLQNGPVAIDGRIHQGECLRPSILENSPPRRTAGWSASTVTVYRAKKVQVWTHNEEYSRGL